MIGTDHSSIGGAVSTGLLDTTNNLGAELLQVPAAVNHHQFTQSSQHYNEQQSFFQQQQGTQIVTYNNAGHAAGNDLHSLDASVPISQGENEDIYSQIQPQLNVQPDSIQSLGHNQTNFPSCPHKAFQKRRDFVQKQVGIAEDKRKGKKVTKKLTSEEVKERNCKYSKKSYDKKKAIAEKVKNELEEERKKNVELRQRRTMLEEELKLLWAKVQERGIC